MRRHSVVRRWTAVMLTAAAVGRAFCQGSGVLTVENADSLVGGEIRGEAIRELIGNVRFHQESVQVRCDRAVQYTGKGRVELLGNVVVRDGPVTLRSPRGVYHRDGRRAEAFDGVMMEDGASRVRSASAAYMVEERIASFQGSVSVEDSAGVLQADSLVSFRAEDRSIAFGSVSVLSRTDGVTVTGGRLESLQGRRISRVTEDPVLYQADTGPGGSAETLIVRSREMELHRDTLRRLVVRDSVEILRGELAGRSSGAVFFAGGDSIHLRGSPVLWYGESQITGDSINVYLRGRRLDRVEVGGNAMAVSRPAPGLPRRFDQLRGERLTMHFTGGELELVRVTGRAMSVFHLFEDTAAGGLNRTTGDAIAMRFRESRLDEVTVAGGVEGRYVPENLLEGAEEEYALPGFFWREDRPRVFPGRVPRPVRRGGDE
ncbi:MAG: OstA-like protein [Bacteroidota bacterium]